MNKTHMSGRCHPASAFAAVLIALSLALTGPVDRASAATDAPQCDHSQLRGEAPPYEGRSVSRLYDRVFSPGPAVPHLRRYVPQGLTMWSDWDGAGNTLLLVGMYRLREESLLVGIDPVDGRHVGSVAIDESHVGGIGVIGDWLITQDTAEAGGTPAVRRYPLERLRAVMRQAARGGEPPYLEAVGDPQEIPGASFMDVAEGSLWAGKFTRRWSGGRMYRYTVDDRGTLHRAEGPWKIPSRSQGLLVTPHHFLFASSDGNRYGQLRAYRRTAPGVAPVPVGCLWTPSLPQNLTLLGDKVFAVYESGARRFYRPHNRIKFLHTAQLATLVRVMDPDSQ